MPLPSFQLSNSEKRNRKIWMGMTLFPYLINLVIMCLYCVQASVGDSSTFLAVLLAVLIGVFSLPPCLIWWCIYKKHGTKLLTTSLVVHSFLMFAGLCAIVGGVQSHLITHKGLVETPLWGVLILFCFNTVWLGLGFQLRKINKKLYLQKHCTEEYIIALEQMQASVSSEDLESNFLLLSKRWPRLRFHSSVEYKAAKLKRKCTPAVEPSSSC